MKIGIITFHRSYNYGSVLQAYALQKYLNNYWGEAKIIDFLMLEDFEQYRLFRTKSYSQKGVRAIASDILYFIPNYRRKRSFEKFIKDYLSLTEKKYTDWKSMFDLNSQFDSFICGSDQIWNLSCTHGIEPAFFLAFVEKGKTKIAYAPSIAHLTFDKNIINQLPDYLSTFDAISVREKSTIRTISPFATKPIIATIDPTLLLSKDYYKEILSKVDNKHYIFVYMLEKNNILIQYVKTLSEKLNLPVIYISKKTQWEYGRAKNVYGISPNKFLGYIYTADYIITNSFHATVFSILFEKKFCTFKTMQSFTRMVDLLNSLGLENRLYPELKDITTNINYIPVREKLKEVKEISVRFLGENLYKRHE